MFKNIVCTVGCSIIGLFTICAIYLGVMYCALLANVVFAFMHIDSVFVVMCLAGFILGMALQNIKSWMETV